MKMGGPAKALQENVEGPLSNVSRGPRGTPEKGLRKANEKTRRRKKRRRGNKLGFGKVAEKKVVVIPLKV